MSNDQSVVLSLGPSGVFSGDKGWTQNNPLFQFWIKQGPIPIGKYKITEYVGLSGYWKLLPTSSKSFPLQYRSGFLLHPGKYSLGCITADKSDSSAMSQYKSIDQLLSNDASYGNTLDVIW